MAVISFNDYRLNHPNEFLIGGESSGKADPDWSVNSILFAVVALLMIYFGIVNYQVPNSMSRSVQELYNPTNAAQLRRDAHPNGANSIP
jgi:hypothetical protein